MYRVIVVLESDSAGPRIFVAKVDGDYYIFRWVESTASNQRVFYPDGLSLPFVESEFDFSGAIR